MNKLINTNDRMVVTREKGQWEQEEEGKGGQEYGDGRRLGFGC